MNRADPASAAARPSLRPSTPWRRALEFEVRRHRGLLAIHGAIAVILVLLAWLLDIHLGVVLILIAARLPADLADRHPEHGRMLRSSLGISRADAVRARVQLVIAGQLLLAVAAAWIILVTDHPLGATHWSTVELHVTADPGPTRLTLGDHLVDIALWSGAITWTHALIGGEAFRLGTPPTGTRALALYIGVCLLAYLVLVGAMLATTALLAALGTDGLAGHRIATARLTAQTLAAVLTLGGGILALLGARRRWIRRA